MQTYISADVTTPICQLANKCDIMTGINYVNIPPDLNPQAINSSLMIDFSPIDEFITLSLPTL